MWQEASYEINSMQMIQLLANQLRRLYDLYPTKIFDIDALF